MGNPKNGGEDDITAKGKYLLISVPEFAKDPISHKAMTSYLRLGAASTTWEQDPGGELEAGVADAGPTGGRLSPDATPVSPVGDSPRPVFVDDLRFRDGSPDPHHLSVHERLKRSKVLHERGGWRDHSDGNRISTTEGDKVEIIRGNYKLVVLGRQDGEPDLSKSSGLDLSGQHFQSFAYTNPSLIRVEWTQDLGGTWHVQETSEGVVHSVNFAGDEYEFKWGLRHESTTGSECPMDKDPDAGGPRQNPHIIEKTWAQKIESYTGSSAWRIPSIAEETWAVDTTSLTDVSGSVTETTNVGGAITSSTTAGSVTETTTVSGSVSSTTTTGSTSEITTSGAINSLTTAGTINEMTTVGVQTGLTTAAAIIDLTLAANKTDVFVGLSSIDVKAVLGQLELTTGFKREYNLTKKWVYTMFEDVELNPKKKVSSLQRQVTALEDTLWATRSRLIAMEHDVDAMKVNLGLAPTPPEDIMEDGIGLLGL